MKIVSREKAIEKKLMRYYTGIPCKRGHTCGRYTKNKICVECSKIKGIARYNKIKEEESQLTLIDKYLQGKL